MHHRLPLLILIASLGSACATSYQSPSPTRAEVQEVRAEIDSLTPERRALTLAEATAVARPVFEAIAADAARICRTVAEADSCTMPSFAVDDLDHVNARAGYSPQHDPEISLTRGLVEYLADQPDALAMVIGHEYGHLITAHVAVKKEGDGTAASIMAAALTVLAAAAQASDGNVYYRGSPSPGYSQREMEAYLRNSADPHGAYEWFSRGEELEADYIGTYLATRSGYNPTGAALLELGALAQRDSLSALEKRDRQLAWSYWDTHPYSPDRAARVAVQESKPGEEPYSPDRAARIRETLEEIELLKAKGYDRPIPPRLILEIQDDTAAFHSLEELVAP